MPAAHVLMTEPPGQEEPAGHEPQVAEVVAPTAVEYVPAEHNSQRKEELDPRLVL